MGVEIEGVCKLPRSPGDKRGDICVTRVPARQDPRVGPSGGLEAGPGLRLTWAAAFPSCSRGGDHAHPPVTHEAHADDGGWALGQARLGRGSGCRPSCKQLARAPPTVGTATVFSRK